jgi:hypothetical protein
MHIVKKSQELLHTFISVPIHFKSKIIKWVGHYLDSPHELTKYVPGNGCGLMCTIVPRANFHRYHLKR